jgi:hypothetical protein
MPTLLAAAALPLGFGVAELTGVRSLGGIVLVAVAAAALVTARAPARAAAPFLVTLMLLFVASHLMADALGSWGAVAVVSALAGVAGWLLLERGRPVAT